MNKHQADKLIIEYLPKIYGFAMKKAFSFDEAEELSSDIVETVYLSLLSAKQILNPDGYVWRISEHVYSKFVSSKKKHEGISINGMDIPDDAPILDEDSELEIDLLRREIAFLTQTRRRIVYSFYYQNKPISAIAKEAGIPEGTVKWHLNKARNDLKEGFIMERKIGKLGIKPIEATGFGHNGDPGNNGGPEYYLGNKLNLNIVYSVYYSPKTMVEIAEELGVTPVYIEDSVKMLEDNGFLVKTTGNRYTTYVKFNIETYSLELEDKRKQKQIEIAEILVREYVPQVRAAIAEVTDVYIPSGNRELLEAAAIFFAVSNNCGVSPRIDLSKYYIKTLAGGNFIAGVFIPAVPSDPDYVPTRSYPSYASCGNMNRWSEKYPVYSWSIDTRYDSREGDWENNLTSDYEYLYEFMTGAIEDTLANKEKFDRLRKRGYLTSDNKVNIVVMRGERNEFFSKLPSLDESIKRTFADYALEQAMLKAKDYPPQMRDLVVGDDAGSFVGGNTVALMVMDILYGNGTLRPITEEERATANLIMFCDRLP